MKIWVGRLIDDEGDTLDTVYATTREIAKRKLVEVLRERWNEGWFCDEPAPEDDETVISEFRAYDGKFALYDLAVAEA